MRAKVDKELCIGCGLCADVCPAVFTMGDDDKAFAIDGPVSGDDEQACRDAAEQCPTEAISIDE